MWVRVSVFLEKKCKLLNIPKMNEIIIQTHIISISE